MARPWPPLRRALLLLAIASLTALVYSRPSLAHDGEDSRTLARASEMDRAVEAIRSGRLVEADRRLRGLWIEPGTRAVAGTHLRALHEDPAFRLPTDSGAVDRAMAALGAGAHRMETAHFVLVSDCDREWTRSRASLLERARHEFMAFAERLGIDAIPHERKLLCVLIEDYGRYRAFAREQDGLDAPWIAGYYSLTHNRIVFYNDVTGPAFERALRSLSDAESSARELREDSMRVERRNRRSDALAMREEADRIDGVVRNQRERIEDEAASFSVAKTIHEAVHLLSFNTGVQMPSRGYPLWLSEGLATSFETDRPWQAFGPRRASFERLGTMRRLIESGGLVPLSRLVTLADAPEGDDSQIEAVYAESCALFSYLYERRREDLRDYLEGLTHAGRPARGAEEHLRLFAAHFGAPEAVEADLVRWVEQVAP